MIDFRRIVVPHDFSAHADAALLYGADLAQRLDSELHLIHVVQLPVYAFSSMQGAAAPSVDIGQVTAEAKVALSGRLEQVAPRAQLTEAHVFEGANVSETVCEASAKLDADLLVMGTHGRTGLAHVFLGSVAERTLRRAPCPVLTVRASEGHE